MRMQQCFAVKVGINPLLGKGLYSLMNGLDVARKTFTETVEDMHTLLKNYRDTYGIPSLK